MSKRILRINQLIKKELSQMILREIDLFQKVLITVTRVETSADLGQTKIFIATLPEFPKAVQILNKKIYDFQHQLNKRLKMKKVPQIRFVEEQETREAARIEGILGGI